LTTSIVITSINPLNQAMQAYTDLANKKNFLFVVAGDSTSPDIQYPGLHFLSLSDQLALRLRYPKLAPVRNYCRKNVAYIYSIMQGATRIIETDDDNFPYDSFAEPTSSTGSSKICEDRGFVNVYRYFTKSTNIWPRGFDLCSLKKKLPSYESLKTLDLHSPIHSGLVDHDPDVDALYRLIFDIPFNFEFKNRSLILARGVWCSFNTQNTTFFPEAYPLMYQPATPLFREADIIRGFVAQRILWENNMYLKFHSPTVKQIRNPHEVIEDLREEVKLYGWVSELCADLERLQISSGPQNYRDAMLKCYSVVEKYGFINISEYELINAWFDDLETIFSKK
jgi:hypothetical protein